MRSVFFHTVFLIYSTYALSIEHDFKETFQDYTQEDLHVVEKQIQNLLPRLKRTVVSIETLDGAGSGVIVTKDGLVISAAHVIEQRGKKMTVILSDGRKIHAVSKGGSQLSDAGMLKLNDDGPFEFATMAKSGSSKVHQWCFALGHPNGYNRDRGIVLRAGKILAKKDETIQTNCRLLGGDSGGALFNLQGEVIGIHSRISNKPEENFHTSIESFLSNWDYFLSEELLTLENLKAGGFLGVSCEQSNNGLLILKVVPGSAAEKLGLFANDELLCLDGIPLDTREKLTILVSKKSPGEVITLDFLRKGREISIQVALGSRQ